MASSLCLPVPLKLLLPFLAQLGEGRLHCLLALLLSAERCLLLPLQLRPFLLRLFRRTLSLVRRPPRCFPLPGWRRSWRGRATRQKVVRFLQIVSCLLSHVAETETGELLGHLSHGLGRYIVTE
jgi:hypothetical protein